jgi:hypothetical protein
LGVKQRLFTRRQLTINVDKKKVRGKTSGIHVFFPEFGEEKAAAK